MMGLSMDRDSHRILVETMKRPMTIRQLSSHLDIPVSICSKKVLHLKLIGLLKRTIYIDNEGNDIVYYERAPLAENLPRPNLEFIHT